MLTALNMAISQRRPREVIHHSDQGSQYTGVAFGARGAQMGVRPSMGSTGDAYDNAMAESFLANLECELIHRAVSRPRPRHASRSLPGSRAGMTRANVTPTWVTALLSISKGFTATP